MNRFFAPRDGVCYPQDCVSYWCFCGGPSWVYEGGDEGLNTGNMSFATGTATNVQATINWDAYTVQYDRFEVFGNSGVLYDSGCVIGSGSATFSIPANTTWIRLEVEPRCNGDPPGTLWYIGVVPYCA